MNARSSRSNGSSVEIGRCSSSRVTSRCSGSAGDQDVVAVGVGEHRDPVLAHEPQLAPALAARDGHVDRGRRLPVAKQTDEPGHHAAAALDRRGPRVRDLPEHLERDRDVVRGEHPDPVDIAVRVAPADPRRVQRRDRPELARARDAPERLDARVVTPLVHHEEPVRSTRRQRGRVGGIVGERLLHEDGHTQVEQLVQHLRVRGGRGDHHRTLNLAQILDRGDDGAGAARLGPLAARRAASDYDDLTAQPKEVTQHVHAPPAAAHECHPGCHAATLAAPGTSRCVALVNALACSPVCRLAYAVGATRPSRLGLGQCRSRSSCGWACTRRVRARTTRSAPRAGCPNGRPSDRS